MPKVRKQSRALTLANLQAAGYAAGGEFPIGPPLPLDSIILKAEVKVSERLSGPSLISATASISNVTNSLSADLLQAGTYRNGGRQMFLTVSLIDDVMQRLTTGSLTATIYYQLYEKADYDSPTSTIETKVG